MKRIQLAGAICLTFLAILMLNFDSISVLAYTDIEVVNYQAPCKPDSSNASVTTWHSGGSPDRRAYDWVCKNIDSDDSKEDAHKVYAPHEGVVKKTANYGGKTQGIIFIEDKENNACIVMLHLDSNSFVVQEGRQVKAGQEIGKYSFNIPDLGAHVHLSALDGACEDNFDIDRSKERPIRFIEFGEVLNERITNSTKAGTIPKGYTRKSTGTRKYVIVGSGTCFSGETPPCDPPSDEAPTGHFPDVPVTHTFFPYIETLYHLGISSGDNGLYMPDAELNRGAATKLVIEAIGEARKYHDDRQTFPDVPPDHTFYHYIERAVELGIVSGFSDGTFKPDNGVTRAALAKMLVNAHDRSEPVYNDCKVIFPDLPCGHPFYSYVRRLKEIFDSKGIGLGFSSGEFKPDDIVDRGAAAKLLIVGLDLEQYLPVFYDVAHDNVFFHYIKAIADRGITKGCDSSSAYPKFCPEDQLTRGQAAAFMVRAIGFTPYYSSGQTFPDVPSSHTFYHHIEFIARNGIVSGFTDGTFRPDDPVSRGEIAKMIVNILSTVIK